RFRPPPGATIKGVTNVPSTGPGKKGAAVAVDSSGMPIPPWRAENRRPTPEECEKFEASLTPEQRERYQQMMQPMRRRVAEGGGAPGGMGPGGGGLSMRKPEGPTTATVYLVDSSQAIGTKQSPTLTAVTIKAGITDGSYTEVIEGLKEGDPVATGSTSSTTT